MMRNEWASYKIIAVTGISTLDDENPVEIHAFGDFAKLDFPLSSYLSLWNFDIRWNTFFCILK